LAPYAQDEKARARLLAAVAAAASARERARQQASRAATMVRLAQDPVLRNQLRETMTQLRKAEERAQRKRSHRLRNTFVASTAITAAAAAAMIPGVRSRLLRYLPGNVGGDGGIGEGREDAFATISEEIEVAVPVATAYNQWTQFEEFPKFMDGVEEVRQLDDTLLRWAASVAGKRAEWDAKIVEQRPDERIVWESVDGKQTRGSVVFEPAGASRTRIRVSMRYRPEAAIEAAGSAVGLDRRRVRGDLERFRDFIEARENETGAWRGEIEETHVIKGGDDQQV